MLFGENAAALTESVWPAALVMYLNSSFSIPLSAPVILTEEKYGPITHKIVILRLGGGEKDLKGFVAKLDKNRDYILEAPFP